MIRPNRQPNSWIGSAIAAIILLSQSTHVLGVDHRVEPLKDGPPDGVAPEIAARLGPGIRVLRGESRTVCDIWFFKEWDRSADKPAQGLLYPFQPGQMIGVLKFPRKGTDFRSQDVGEGIYTLRYGQQPVDGAHVGTSITRDFLLMTSIATDTSLAIPDYKSLTKRSSEAAGSSHPAILSLQPPDDKSELRIQHVDEQDWWIVRMVGKIKSENQPIAVVVAGHAKE